MSDEAPKELAVPPTPAPQGDLFGITTEEACAIATQAVDAFSRPSAQARDAVTSIES